MTNTEKFTGKAIDYDKYRPGYPQALYNEIILKASLTDKSVIADIGAGTGKFSLPLLKAAYKVYCVEPNADMKERMDKNLGAFDGYMGVNATAEDTTFPINSVDCIVVAQAFHWFNRDFFRLECRRILKPQGKVFLIWNTRDEKAQSTQELYAVNKKYCPNFKGFSGGVELSDKNQFNDFFKNESCAVQIYHNDVFYDSVESFVGRTLSSSYALKPSENGFDEYVRELKGIYDKYADGNGFALKHKTVVFYGEV